MPEHIDPDAYVPRYYQLANILRERILDGKLAAHQSIPSEREGRPPAATARRGAHRQ